MWLGEQAFAADLVVRGKRRLQLVKAGNVVAAEWLNQHCLPNDDHERHLIRWASDAENDRQGA